MSLLFEIIPLLIFFVSYKLSTLVIAAIIFSVSSIVSNLLQYVLYKKISYLNLFGALLITIFSSISYFTNDTSFIKIKPTLINLILGISLIVGYINKKSFVKYLMPNNLELDDGLMLKLSRNFGIFFIFLALINEVIWRNFNDDVWVKFKVFGIFGATFVFLLMNIGLFKNLIKIDPKNE